MRLGIVAAFFLVLSVLPVVAEPWPVSRKAVVPSSGDPNAVTEADMQSVTTSVPTVVGVPYSLSLRTLKRPILERQFVTATMGEPRGLQFSPPPLYLHNGTDISAPVRTLATKVFAIQGGTVHQHIDDGDPAHGESRGQLGGDTDYESLHVADFRYMHVRVDRDIATAYMHALRAGIELRLPELTHIGDTFVPVKPIPPHVHLQLESRAGRFYGNALARLSRWADRDPPVFVPGPGPEWNRPAVRLVPDFDSTKRLVPPAFFPFAALPGVGSMPVVSRAIDILARIDDHNRGPDPGEQGDLTVGVAPGSGFRVAPVDVGFRVEALDEMTRSVSRTAVPTSVRIDFQESIPYGKDLTTPEFSASEAFFHRMYWVEIPAGADLGRSIGTMTKVGGGVERMDFIVTNTRVTAPDPALRHRTDYWDTDRQETRNGHYRVTVIARDLGGYRATSSDGIGAATTRAADVIVCNEALATSARDTGEPKPAVAGVFQLGNRVELVGHNFFTPLGAAGVDVPPRIAILEVADGVLRRVASVPLLASERISGDNTRGLVAFNLPSTGLKPGAEYRVGTVVQCDPNRALLDVAEPDWSRDTRAHPLITLAADAPAPFSIIYSNVDPDTGEARVSLKRSDGESRVLNSIQGLGAGGVIVRGLDVSDDGERYAFVAAADASEGNQMLAIHDVSGQRLAHLTLPNVGAREISDVPSLDARGHHIAFMMDTWFPMESGGGFLPGPSEIHYASVPTDGSMLSTKLLRRGNLVGPEWETFRDPLLTPDGGAVVFEDETSQSLLRVRAPSGELLDFLPHLDGFDPAHRPRLMDDGTAIVQASAGDSSALLWRPSGETSSFPSTLREAGVEFFADISRDGSTGLVVVGGHLEVIRMQAPSYPALQVIPIDDDVWDWRLGADGRQVVLVRTTGNERYVPSRGSRALEFDLEAIDVPSGSRRRVVQGAWFIEVENFLGKVVGAPQVAVFP